MTCSIRSPPRASAWPATRPRRSSPRWIPRPPSTRSPKGASRGWMEQLRGSGLDIRITPDLPLKMQSFDDEVVLVSMQDPAGGEPSFTAVAIHNRGVVAMLNLAFEHLWNNARPFRGEPERGRR